MSTKAQIKTRCPVCGKVYKVRASAGGHRAKCGECGTVFRVPVPAPDSARQPVPASSPHGHPTEEDILNWLNEGLDDDDRPIRPPLREDVPAGRSAGKNPTDNGTVGSKEPRQSPPANGHPHVNGSTVQPAHVSQRITLKRMPQLVAQRRAG